MERAQAHVRPGLRRQRIAQLHHELDELRAHAHHIQELLCATPLAAHARTRRHMAPAHTQPHTSFICQPPTRSRTHHSSATRSHAAAHIIHLPAVHTQPCVCLLARCASPADPQEKKTKQSLFWYGLGLNIFVGNTIAITQQALWGRALDYGAVGGGRPIVYSQVVREGLKAEGAAAFYTPAKWFTRVLMNAPVQGTLPWFYNDVLPRFEGPVLRAVAKLRQPMHTASSTVA